MNCYYSNLIEGHDTHPSISSVRSRTTTARMPQKRDLQLEAKAHIAVQQWIDEGGLQGRAVTRKAILEIHRRFCELLPEELLWVDEPDTSERLRVIPGELRTRDVKVDQHIAVSPGACRASSSASRGLQRLGRTDSILAAAAAHHRLLWIHPFLDGNGRVARLMSHAMLLETLDTGGVWSIARGLARNVTTYKSQLADCDLPRRNDLDGRGTLSEEALADFTRFFLETCLDQVTFMEGLVQPDRLRARILLWAEEEIRLGQLPPSPAASSKRCSIAASCRAAMSLQSSAPARARPGASSLPCSTKMYSRPKARAIRCASPSPRRSPRAGCRGCFRNGQARICSTDPAYYRPRILRHRAVWDWRVTSVRLARTGHRDSRRDK